MLTVTVGEADACRVRRALCYCGPDCVEFVRLTPVPRGKRVRLQIALKAEAASEAMSKIISSVDEAEFGRTAVTPYSGVTSLEGRACIPGFRLPKG